MQAESNIKLPAAEIERDGDKAIVIVRVDFQEIERTTVDDEGNETISAVWQWKENHGEVPWFSNIVDVINADVEGWYEALEPSIIVKPLTNEELADAIAELGEYVAGLEG